MKLIKFKSWFTWNMKIIKTLDAIKNVLFVYLFSSLIAWDFNPADWCAFGRFLFGFFVCMGIYLAYE